MKNFRILSATLLITILISCDIYTDADFQRYYVLESILQADSSIADVYLYTTHPIDENFEFSEVAVSGANMRLSLLNSSDLSVIDEQFTYSMAEPGVYVADNREHKIQARRSYRIDIEGLNNPEISSSKITATTVVPDTFRTVRLGFESENPRPPFVPGSVAEVRFQQDDQLVIDITRGELTGGRSQNVYIFTIQAQNPSVENLTPFYAGFVDDLDLEELANNESNLLNQENYVLNSDNTVSIQFPWIAIAFYGQNRVVASSIDKNLFDFRRSLLVQTQGGTVSPGEIYNAVYNMEGGIGVFGSLSQSFFDVNVAPLF